jgi:hypothetical protein
MRLGLGISIPGTSGLVQAAFSPLDLSPTVWLDASDTSTITEVGGAVSQWDDKSGNNNNVVQANAAAQPTTGTRTINSLNVIDFDGSDGMPTASASNILQPNTVFLVFETDVNTLQYVFDSRASVSARHFFAFDTDYTIEAGTAISGGTTDFDPHIARIVYNGASSSLFIDAVSTISGNAGSEQWELLGLGARRDGGFPFDGAIAELIVIDGTLTAGEIADCEQYLANKWGITI